ncbi:MAG: hypothetical protein A2355_10600, partial [Spirochaetes bacterium RIFOXYB1_FULL_32_8]
RVFLQEAHYRFDIIEKKNIIIIRYENNKRRNGMKLKFIIVLITMYVSFFSFGEVKEMVFVCEDKEDFPSVTGNSNELSKVNPGVVVELLLKMETVTGIKITIKRLPWKRALESELKNGSADGLFLASYKKERELFGSFPKKDGEIDESRCVYSSRYVFYTLKDSEVTYDGKNLHNFTGAVGAPLGYSIVEDLKKIGFIIDESSGTDKDFEKMIGKRVNAVAALEMNGDAILSKNPQFASLIKKLEPAIVSKPYYIMLSNQFVAKNPDTANKIWNTLRDIRDKDLNILLKKYF